MKQNQRPAPNVGNGSDALGTIAGAIITRY
jgi:hypothetical protein